MNERLFCLAARRRCVPQTRALHTRGTQKNVTGGGLATRDKNSVSLRIRVHINPTLPFKTFYISTRFSLPLYIHRPAAYTEEESCCCLHRPLSLRQQARGPKLPHDPIAHQPPHPPKKYRLDEGIILPRAWGATAARAAAAAAARPGARPRPRAARAALARRRGRGRRRVWPVAAADAVPLQVAAERQRPRQGGLPQGVSHGEGRERSEWGW